MAKTVKAVNITRREFFKRTAPLVATGLVTPAFVSRLVFELFGPKKYWELRPSRYVLAPYAQCIPLQITMMRDYTSSNVIVPYIPLQITQVPGFNSISWEVSAT
jgi:hypothetical protein